MSTTGISDALGKMSDAIAADPAKAHAKAAPATARLLEGLRCEVAGPKGEMILTDCRRARVGRRHRPAGDDRSGQTLAV
jgi:hypothetical protein